MISVEVIPFIERLDLVVAEGEPLNLAASKGYHVVSRFGAVGEGVPVEPTAFIEALRDMESLTLDEAGQEIQRAKGSTIVGHRLHVVLWLVRHVNPQGQRSPAGDGGSWGAMGSSRPTAAGPTIPVRYPGLPGGHSEAFVTFRRANTSDYQELGPFSGARACDQSALNSTDADRAVASLVLRWRAWSELRQASRELPFDPAPAERFELAPCSDLGGGPAAAQAPSGLRIEAADVNAWRLCAPCRSFHGGTSIGWKKVADGNFAIRRPCANTPLPVAVGRTCQP